jgi:hypothetical protein
MRRSSAALGAASNGKSASFPGYASSSEISGGDQAIDSDCQAPYDLVRFRRQPHVRESLHARTADLQMVEELARELHSRPPRIGNRRRLFLVMRLACHVRLLRHPGARRSR